jgi:hypothetical protein
VSIQQAVKTRPTPSTLRRGLDFLASQQNDDGGWGYLAGGQSLVEPTCYSLLALRSLRPSAASDEHLRKVVKWLTAQSAQSGLLSFQPNNKHTDNWGIILLCFTLHQLQVEAELRDKCLAHLLQSRGRRIEAKAAAPLRLNGDLQAWSWYADTASWVEPTAYALLTLKSQGMQQHERVGTGEAYLLDRACYQGGWNYGNKEVLDVVLEPMPTNTAYALLALQDYERTHPVIQKSLHWLERELTQRQSVLSLALGALCLNVYGQPVHPWLQQLSLRQEADGSWLSNNHLTALSLLALGIEEKKENVFLLRKNQSTVQG